MANKVRIVVADDHRMVRKAWELLLSERKNFSVVGQAANGAEVLRVLEETRADVVLMDLDMPIMNGIEATDHIKTNYPWIKVIALTMQKDSVYIQKTFAAGAKAYLTKNASEQELIEAIGEVLAGKSYLGKEVGEVLAHSMLEQKSEPTFTSQELTARELEIVKLIAKGSTTSQIAVELGLSVKTIETHRRNIFIKLQVKNVAQLLSRTKEWVA